MNDIDTIKQDFDPNLPLDRAKTIPSRWYVDTDILRAEENKIFARTWQCVARTDQLEQRGSYITCTIGGEPVIVLRDDQGALRAMSNVCRHRAAVIAKGERGCVDKLRCRYHGWTYDLCGRLRGLPEWDGVEEFAKDKEGLPSFHVETLGPLVWVHLAGGGEAVPPLQEFVSPLAERLPTSAMGNLAFVERRDYVLECNWKVFVDNYLDGGYHVNTVHPGLAGVLDYSKYKTEIFGLTSLQSSPLTTPKAGTTTTSLVRTGDVAQYWHVFPNFMLNLYEGMMDTNLVIPMGPERCRVLIDFFFANRDGAEARALIERSIAVGNEIQEEDIGICEDVQRGLHSRTYDKGRFSVRREIAGHNFQRLLAQWLAK